MEEKLRLIIKILYDKKKTISTMESCTGGMVANAITNIEGSSDIFKFGAVTYSNEYKIKMGVDANIIEKYSVYSIQTAIEMSKTICQYTNSDYGIGITGRLNSIDKNNIDGNITKVYVSIYDKGIDKIYTLTIDVPYCNRKDNKNFVVDKIVKLLSSIIVY